MAKILRIHMGFRKSPAQLEMIFGRRFEIVGLYRRGRQKMQPAPVHRSAARRAQPHALPMTEYQQASIAVRTENVRARKAELLSRLARHYAGDYRLLLEAYAARELTGAEVLPAPGTKRT